MTPWCKRELREMAYKALGGDLAKRLLGVGMIWPKDSLVLIQPLHQGVFLTRSPQQQGVFWPDHTPILKAEGGLYVVVSCWDMSRMSKYFSKSPPLQSVM